MFVFRVFLRLCTRIVFFVTLQEKRFWFTVFLAIQADVDATIEDEREYLEGQGIVSKWPEGVKDGELYYELKLGKNT